MRCLLVVGVGGGGEVLGGIDRRGRRGMAGLWMKTLRGRLFKLVPW